MRSSRFVAGCRVVALALFGLALWAQAAEAKTFRLGVPPVASVTLPDAWSPEETDRGVEATSDDDEIYIAIEVAALSRTEDAVKRALAFLISEGVVIDPATERQTQGKINGLDTIFLSYSGKDEDGEPTEISVGVTVANPSTILILTYWGTPAGEKKHEKTLSTILDSLRPVR